MCSQSTTALAPNPRIDIDINSLGVTPHSFIKPASHMSCNGVIIHGAICKSTRLAISPISKCAPVEPPFVTVTYREMISFTSV